MAHESDYGAGEQLAMGNVTKKIIQLLESGGVPLGPLGASKHAPRTLSGNRANTRHPDFDPDDFEGADELRARAAEARLMRDFDPGPSSSRLDDLDELIDGSRTSPDEAVGLNDEFRATAREVEASEPSLNRTVREMDLRGEDEAGRLNRIDVDAEIAGDRARLASEQKMRDLGHNLDDLDADNPFNQGAPLPEEFTADSARGAVRPGDRVPTPEEAALALRDAEFRAAQAGTPDDQDLIDAIVTQILDRKITGF